MKTFDLDYTPRKPKEVPDVLIGQDGLFAEYCNTCREIQRLENHKDKLKSSIMDTLNEAKADTYRSDYGTFTRAKRLSYTYSDIVKMEEENLKSSKEEEVRNGTAKTKEIEFLVYRDNDKI